MTLKARIEKIESQLTPARPERETIVILPAQQEGYVVVHRNGQDTLLTRAEADTQYPGARVIRPLSESDQ